jgi:hypothetical protein
MIVVYMLLSAAKDFRDNFAPELWAAFDYHAPPALFAGSEIVVGFCVTIPILVFMLIKSHIHALVSYHVLIVAAMVATGGITALYAAGSAKGFAFMVLSGIGLHLAYAPFTNIIYDLILVTFTYKANSGLLMYISDSLGYLSSVAVVMVRNFAMPELAWDHFFVMVNYGIAAVGTVLMSLSLVYSVAKYRNVGMYPPEFSGLSVAALGLKRMEGDGLQ